MTVEFVARVQAWKMDWLRDWLKRPNGSVSIGQVTFDAVEGGGILIRSRPHLAEKDTPDMSAKPPEDGFWIEVVAPHVCITPTVVDMNKYGPGSVWQCGHLRCRQRWLFGGYTANPAKPCEVPVPQWRRLHSGA